MFKNFASSVRATFAGSSISVATVAMGQLGVRCKQDQREEKASGKVNVRGLETGFCANHSSLACRRLSSILVSTVAMGQLGALRKQDQREEKASGKVKVRGLETGGDSSFIYPFNFFFHSQCTTSQLHHFVQHSKQNHMKVLLNSFHLNGTVTHQSLMKGIQNHPFSINLRRKVLYFNLSLSTK